MGDDAAMPQTSRGSDALTDVHRKLDWATAKHDEMLRIFEEY